MTAYRCETCGEYLSIRYGLIEACRAHTDARAVSWPREMTWALDYVLRGADPDSPTFDARYWTGATVADLRLAAALVERWGLKPAAPIKTAVGLFGPNV